MKWKVGQQVYCLQNGDGVIEQIDNDNGIYQIIARFSHITIGHYRKDGRLAPDHKTPMLYPSKPEIILPKWQPKPGQWCWFWDDQFKFIIALAKFKRMVNNEFETELNETWDNCAKFTGELPDHLKEVQS